ncbi:hypothetical protein CDEF62S_03631 [Castellaniella defragrans]
MVTMVTLQALVIQGNKLGWTSPIGLALLIILIVFGWIFLRIENRKRSAFFDFGLFKNTTYTGATISNFLINGTAGTLIVSLQLVQIGVGLAFYATPSTDAALSNLPAAQTGSGSGIYKMASSLGAAFGVAISAAIFTALNGNGADWLAGAITFVGRQDNLAVREAAMIALGFNVLMVAVAILSIMLTIPKEPKAQV